MTERAAPPIGVAAALQAIWYAPARPPWLLRVLAVVFGLAISLRALVYRAGLLRTRRLPVPVIVIGNLAVGGTGKTPLVIWLVEQLRALGLTPGVVLRGYGGRATHGAAPTLVNDDSDPAQVGDEALLLRLRTGVAVAVHRQRVRAAQRLLQEGVDVIVSDDGLQHLALARDAEIAVVDAGRGLGNGYLLPAGPLREPAARLRRVDCVVMNGDRQHAVVPSGPAALTMHLTGDRLWPLSGCGQPCALSGFAGQRVHAIAGIGNPARFFQLLREAGLELLEHPFPDHHPYLSDELAFGDGLPVLMTEKDAVKCRRFAAPEAWYLPVSGAFSASEGALLLERLKAAAWPADAGRGIHGEK